MYNRYIRNDDGEINIFEDMTGIRNVPDPITEYEFVEREVIEERIWDEKKLERYGGKWYRGCPSALNFFNRTTGKNLVVISEMPENGHTPENQNPYHIDPHPRFTENEKYAIFTTTELGGVDLGVVVVDELLELTK